MMYQFFEGFDVVGALAKRNLLQFVLPQVKPANISMENERPNSDSLVSKS